MDNIIELDLNGGWFASNKDMPEGTFKFIDEEGDHVFSSRIPYETSVLGYNVLGNVILEAYIKGQDNGVKQGIRIQKEVVNKYWGLK